MATAIKADLHKSDLLVGSGGPTDNNYDVLRFLLATAVIVSHAWPVAFGMDARQPLSRLLQGATLGDLAVGGFFAISGYLVTASWRASTPLRYLQKRAARILPGFVAACLLTVGLACATSTDPSASARCTSWVRAAETTVTLRRPVVYLAYSANPYPAETNASLWTIKYEVGCYAATALLGFAGLVGARRRYFVLALFLGLIIAGGALGCSSIARSPLSYSVHLFTFYTAGMIVYCFRDVLRRSRWMAGLCALLLVASTLSRLWVLCALPTAGVYLLFGFIYAKTRFVPDLKRKVGDLSYGMYLCGWPVAQSLEALFRGQNIVAWPMAAFSILASLPIAYASWHLVEKPMLSLVTNDAHRHALLSKSPHLS